MNTAPSRSISVLDPRADSTIEYIDGLTDDNRYNHSTNTNDNRSQPTQPQRSSQFNENYEYYDPSGNDETVGANNWNVHSLNRIKDSNSLNTVPLRLISALDSRADRTIEGIPSNKLTPIRISRERIIQTSSIL